MGIGEILLGVSTTIFAILVFGGGAIGTCLVVVLLIGRIVEAIREKEVLEAISFFIILLLPLSLIGMLVGQLLIDFF